MAATIEDLSVKHIFRLNNIGLGERKLLKKTVSGIMLTLLLTSMLTLAFNIQPAKASGTIYTSPGGSIDARRAKQRDPVGTLFNTRVRPVSAYSLASHSPIFIGSDSEFVPANGVTPGGSGTASNPYIIENWDIDASTTDGITIVSTRAYFVIRNVVVHDGGSTYYGIWLWNVTNGEVLAVNTTRNCIGIAIDSSSGNTVSGSTAANNSWGVYLWSSNGIVISENKITNNYNNGITLDLSSSDNTVSGNEVTLNGYIGVALYSSSSSNTISGNTITSDNFGILLYASSSDNALFGNCITNTIDTGIYFYSSSGNRFYHNNLVNNLFEAWSNNSTNAWDDGYPSGGNYWSNYIDGYPAGVDSFSGPYQNVTGSDGIGDTPYVIDANNPDNYPFMNTTLLVPWIADPSNGTWVSGNAEIAAIEYDFYEIAGASFEYSKNALDWSLIGVDNNGTDGTYEAQWNTSLVDEGWYYLRVTMYDAFRHFGQSAIQVYVDPTPPVPSITQPLDNSEIASYPTQLQATTQAKDVAGVVFAYLNVSNPDFEKPLTILSQPDAITCTPTAEASSLLWLAQQYPDATDLVTAEMKADPSILIKILKTKMGTGKNGHTGTTIIMAQRGVYSYLNAYYARMHLADKKCVTFKERSLLRRDQKAGFKWFSFFKKYVQQEDLLINLRLELTKTLPNGTTITITTFHSVTGMSFDLHAQMKLGNPPITFTRVDFMDPDMETVDGKPKGGVVSGWMDEGGNIIGLEREDGSKKYGPGVKVSIDSILVLSPQKDFKELSGAKDPYGWTVIGVNTDGRDGWTTTWDTSALPKGPYLLLAVMVDSAGNVASDIIWVELSGAWPMFHHDLGHTGYSSSPASDTNGTGWIYSAQYMGTASSPAVIDGKVYVGRGDGVYALDESNGQLTWKAEIGAVESSPAIANGMVFASYEYGNVYALNASTGAHIWNYVTGEVHSSPTVSDGIVFISSLDGMVYGLNCTTGALKWSYRIAPPWAGGTYFIYSSPAVADGKLYVGSWDQNVYCLNATTGSLIWTYLTGGIVLSSPSVVDGVVCVGSNDGRLYALNSTTGALIWTYSTAAPIGSCPAIADGMVFVGTLGGAYNVYALNMTTGALVWRYGTAGLVWSSPAVADGKVYVGSEDNRIYCLNATTGTFIWSYATGGWVLSSPAVADGVVFVGSWDGKVYAFGEPPPDIAVMSVTPSKTVVGQGYSQSVNVTVQNQGLLPETFNVTLYADVTEIGTQTVNNMPNGTTTILTFTWNTTGFAKGNYTISAYASPVSNETDTEDNLFTDGFVKIGIPGDINGDTVVDSTDLGILGIAWGSFKGDLNYVPEADINDDGVADSSDLGIMGAHWGEFTPQAHNNKLAILFSKN
jgi:parallel beta-helix repeat protein